ncbi:superoxide dismutase, partial [Diaporthe amygdali]|uniref:superoxide dismutase n=1 Tax=Phomopsis amygdali TaxID=1214568 RepID=UPI0022FE08EC
PDGIGVIFKVQFSELPNMGGPFKDGNCTATLAHLDPFKRGEMIPCDPSAPQTCQVGDLSGKHGHITSESFDATYTDNYAALEEGIGSYFGNRSFVLHFENKTRITCANFERVDPGGYSAKGANSPALYIPACVPRTTSDTESDPGNQSTQKGASPSAGMSPGPTIFKANESTLMLEAGRAACAAMS